MCWSCDSRIIRFRCLPTSKSSRFSIEDLRRPTLKIFHRHLSVGIVSRPRNDRKESRVNIEERLADQRSRMAELLHKVDLEDFPGNSDQR